MTPSITPLCRGLVIQKDGKPILLQNNRRRQAFFTGTLGRLSRRGILSDASLPIARVKIAAVKDGFVFIKNVHPDYLNRLPSIRSR